MWRKLFVVMGLIYAGTSLKAEVQVSERHMMILNPGVDAIWGNYLFLVSNSGSEPAPLSMDLLLPKETVDWQALDNLDPADLKLGSEEEGAVRLEKMIPPGDLLVSVGFKVDAFGGEAKMSFRPRDVNGSLTFLVNDKSLQISGETLEFRPNQPFQNGRYYDTFTIKELSAEAAYELGVTGIPEGRGRFWILGWIVFASLLSGVLLLAWFTRNGLHAHKAQTVASSAMHATGDDLGI